MTDVQIDKIHKKCGKPLFLREKTTYPANVIDFVGDTTLWVVCLHCQRKICYLSDVADAPAKSTPDDNYIA